ncbi:hypothetical protein M8J76_011570 [Diaphorina citri]|nr:hypothetical protein M8J75_002622 [Diaphorina citri]KAI5726945.1 hypothetical protein M8J76_011570 [Diaphorina citri]
MLRFRNDACHSIVVRKEPFPDVSRSATMVSKVINKQIKQKAGYVAPLRTSGNDRNFIGMVSINLDNLLS